MIAACVIASSWKDVSGAPALDDGFLKAVRREEEESALFAQAYFSL